MLDRYQKLTDDLKEDVVSCEKHTEAKLKIITSNVAIQQEQLDQIAEYVNTIKPINFGHINNELPKLIATNNSLVKQYDLMPTLVENIKQFKININKTNELVATNLERIRQRTRIYDGNFSLIYQTLKVYKSID